MLLSKLSRKQRAAPVAGDGADVHAAERLQVVLLLLLVLSRLALLLHGVQRWLQLIRLVVVGPDSRLQPQLSVPQHLPLYVCWQGVKVAMQQRPHVQAGERKLRGGLGGLGRCVQKQKVVVVQTCAAHSVVERV